MSKPHTLQTALNKKWVSAKCLFNVKWECHTCKQKSKQTVDQNEGFKTPPESPVKSKQTADVIEVVNEVVVTPNVSQNLFFLL